MNRTELMQQIAVLDKQIHEASGAHRIGSLGSRRRAFPIANWVVGLLFVGAYVFGGAINSALHEKWGLIAGALGAFFLLTALIRSILWLTKRAPGADKAYTDSMKKVAGLTEQRKILQAHLERISKG